MIPGSPQDPPFRADHVGSLLRPSSLLEARAAHRQGELSDEDLRAREDAAIREVVAFQENLGLQSVTDGEYRRYVYYSGFLSDGLSGVTIRVGGEGGFPWKDDEGNRIEGIVPVVHDRIRWRAPVHVADFTYLKSVTTRTPKMTIPSPVYLHFQGGRENINAEVYPDLDLFWDDLIGAYRKELAALGEAGCSYVQIDETSLAKVGDPDVQTILKNRGDDWRELTRLYVDIINAAIAERPPGMRVGLHLCRGNNRGYWQAQGGYDLVADHLFNQIDVDFYFLEYDTPRAGDFAPLRYLPKHKTAVLGLVSTKTPLLESADHLKRRIDEASRVADLDQLALCPQCGFASVEHGNELSVEDEAAKLRRIVEVADAVWG